MAQAGQTIENIATGERIVFRKCAADTDGKLLEFDDFWSRPGHRAPAHIHPAMEEVGLSSPVPQRFASVMSS